MRSSWRRPGQLRNEKGPMRAVAGDVSEARASKDSEWRRRRALWCGTKTEARVRVDEGAAIVAVPSTVLW